MRGGQIAAAGVGGGTTGLVSAWLWNEVLPRLISPEAVVGWPMMPPEVAPLLGSALLGGLAYLVSFLPAAGSDVKPPAFLRRGE